jgi:hypothetical protein
VGLAFSPDNTLLPEHIDARWSELNEFSDVEYPGEYADAAKAIKPVFDNVGLALPD